MKPSVNDQLEYESLDFGGRISTMAVRYGQGERRPAVVDTLAFAKVLSDRLGIAVETPGNIGRTEWNETLTNLVAERLGDTLCLDCRSYFTQSEATSVFIGIGDESIEGIRCPGCMGTLCEPIECVENATSGRYVYAPNGTKTWVAYDK